MKSLFAATALLLCGGAVAQQPASAPSTAAFQMLDGAWAGTATLTTPQGPRQLRHTERVGPMLGGQVRVIEGRSYEVDGSDAGFNALAVISATTGGGYEFRSYAQGRSGTFPLTATGTGFSWTMTAGPMTFRYTAVVKDGSWHEEGVMERPGAAPVTVIRLDLRRIAPTDWPGANPVPPVARSPQ